LWNRIWFMLLVCVAFWELDWEMVPVAVFPFVFIFPVMLVAWNRGLKLALICCLAFSLSRVAREYLLDLRPMGSGEIAEALVRFFVFVLLATLTTLLARQSRQLRERVKQLEGILPICASCKSIRDEKGDWTQLEGYLTTHTPAQFSHSFCPECFKAYYGNIPYSSAAEAK
jgi:K+-sensing histidine kinase KdpD